MYTLPELSYAYNALEPVIDEKTMMIHHDKHHAAYIKNLNDALKDHQDILSLPIETLVQQLQLVPESIRTKVRNNAGGHYNHSLFWTIMIPGGTDRPTGKLADAIDANCGDFSTFIEHFSKRAMGRFGSGWAWLLKESDGSVSISDTPNQDNPLMDGKIPLLGLDLWEHAYYLKYQNLRADYIKAWWSVVNWKEVQSRYEAV